MTASVPQRSLPEAGSPEADGLRTDDPARAVEPERREPDAAPPPGLDRKLVPLYSEAAAVAEISPASACALARLLLRSLIRAQGLRGRHLVRDISELVSSGAPVGLLRALDVLKLSDTEARRPGELNLANGHGDARNLLMFVHLFTQHVPSPQ
ncbi:hypothetical protein [Candidatus Poriferisodalis sp.]|uniref:hypothetical protein n=1 Tax=Candidatus Poriferisodalis sp. TaxID=3101277 RepID=UPI003B0234D3